MNELGQTLKSGWKSSGSDITPPHIPAQLISEAQRLNRESKKFQWSTLLILGSTFLMMCYFLLVYFGFREALSHVGVVIMLGFFLLRIVLEAYSIMEGGKKEATDSAIESLEKEKKYLELRLRIHGFYTFLTLSAYTLGFLLLLPEFSNYISSFWMAALVCSYFIPGIILTLLIRKNVQKELRELRMVVELKEKILG
jgi:amino acid transporter